MRAIFPALLALSLGIHLTTLSTDAAACGGCAVPADESTQVTGHRMIFSISKTQTTLYDQIEYAGEPESFAWFLPISGQVDIGLSADAMFAYLGNASSVSVFPPPFACANSRGDVLTAEDSSQGGTYVPPEGEVNVIAQEVVGPYETVQLEATTPDALVNWLASHGYKIPADVEPVIGAYQQEGFGFLAMKLVPGEGVRSMRPVRITTHGAGLTLPLRMVAAGTGAVTSMTLYIVAEGKYEPTGRPVFTTPENLLVWNWADNTSNYQTVREELLKASGGKGFLMESAAPFNPENLSSQVKFTIENNPGTTDWAGAIESGDELAGAMEDLDVLRAGKNGEDVWLTRLYASLSRDGLKTDLTIGASPEQASVTRYLRAQQSVGEPPQCNDENLSCAMAQGESGFSKTFGFGLIGLAAAVAALRRRTAPRK